MTTKKATQKKFTKSVTSKNRVNEFKPEIEDVLPKFSRKKVVSDKVIKNIITTIHKLKAGQSFFVPKTVVSDGFLRNVIKDDRVKNKRIYQASDIRVSKILSPIEGSRVSRFS